MIRYRIAHAPRLWLALFTAALLVAPPAVAAPGPDSDGDGLADVEDPCPDFANTLPLADVDGYGIPDECQCGDAEGDGDLDAADLALLQDCLAGTATCDIARADTDLNGVFTWIDPWVVDSILVGDFQSYVAACSLRQTYQTVKVEHGLLHVGYDDEGMDPDLGRYLDLTVWNIELDGGGFHTVMDRSRRWDLEMGLWAPVSPTTATELRVDADAGSEVDVRIARVQHEPASGSWEIASALLAARDAVVAANPQLAGVVNQTNGVRYMGLLAGAPVYTATVPGAELSLFVQPPPGGGTEATIRRLAASTEDGRFGFEIGFSEPLEMDLLGVSFTADELLVEEADQASYVDAMVGGRLLTEGISGYTVSGEQLTPAPAPVPSLGDAGGIALAMLLLASATFLPPWRSART